MQVTINLIQLLDSHPKQYLFTNEIIQIHRLGTLQQKKNQFAYVETLKQLCIILLGQQLRVYTDHKNLTGKNFNNNRVSRWRLILEEYGTEIKYTPGVKNMVS